MTATRDVETTQRLDHVEMVYRPGERELAARVSGRVSLLGVYDPSEPGAYAPGMFQAFVRTDVVAGGLLALGQFVELQWHLPRSAER